MGEALPFAYNKETAVCRKGDVFGDWTIRHAFRGEKQLCRCKCGYEKMVKKSDLRRGSNIGCSPSRGCVGKGHKTLEYQYK